MPSKNLAKNPARGTNFFKNKIYWFLLSLIIILGFALRWHDYASFPSVTETADEQAWAWLGSSLLATGQPTAWSLFPAYQQPQFIYRQLPNHAPLVRPFLDHPPLFALIPGTMHLLRTQQWTDFPSQKAVRFPMILIGTLNIFLLGWALKLYFQHQRDQTANLITTLLYATTPLIVFSSRLAVADNLLASWGLLSLVAVRKKWFKFAYLMVILAILSKVQGIFIAAGLIIYFWLIKDKKNAWWTFFASLVGLALFYLYGAFYNQALFIKIFFGQSSRQIGLITLLHRFVFHPTLVSHWWPTASKLALFFAGIFLLWKSKLDKANRLLLPASLFLSFLLLTLAAVDELNINGWYDYALYPILFFGVKLIVDDFIQHNQILKTWFVWLWLILPSARLMLAIRQQTATIAPTTVRTLVFLPAMAFLWPNKQKIFSYFVIAFFVIINIVIVWHLKQPIYSDLNWHLLNY